jgi:hypothetical protein
VPSLGATRYTVGPDRLNQQARGEDAPFNQTILRFPGCGAGFLRAITRARRTCEFAIPH